MIAKKYTLTGFHNPTARSVGAIEFQAQPETIKLHRDMNHVSWATRYAAFNVSEFKRREVQDRIEIVR